MSIQMVEEIAKTSWRLPKDKVRQLKQYALDHDMSVTDVLIQAIDAFFASKTMEGKKLKK